MALSVSELAARAGISPDTVRYYGRVGLLPEAGRTGGGHRYYDESALERVRFIKGAQWFEMRLDEIRELLDVFDRAACPCGTTRDLLVRRIAAIDEQRGRLEEIRAALCRVLGADPATDEQGEGEDVKDSGTTVTMTEPGATAGAGAAPGCTCCKPAETGPRDERRELQARREAVLRRLARLQGLRR